MLGCAFECLENLRITKCGCRSCGYRKNGKEAFISYISCRIPSLLASSAGISFGLPFFSNLSEQDLQEKKEAQNSWLRSRPIVSPLQRILLTQCKEIRTTEYIQNLFLEFRMLHLGSESHDLQFWNQESKYICTPESNPLESRILLGIRNPYLRIRNLETS